MDAVKAVEASFTSEQKQEAADLEFKIEQVVSIIVAEKRALDSNYVKLSQYINEVRQKKYWLLGNYRTFGDYLESIEKKFGLGHSQLYVGMKVARNLLPSVAEKDLVDMGITKAGVLSKYVEQSGQNVVPEEILTLAKDPKTRSDQLDAAVNAKLHNVGMEKGKWYSMGGFFCTEDEKQEIEDALALAGSIDPLVPNNIPMWQQHKEKVLRLAREFMGTYAGVQ